MQQHSHPIEFLIDFAWANGADRFIVNNAKDELKRLREKNKEWEAEVFRANQFAVEEMNRNLEYQTIGYARVNSRGDLYDPRLCSICNPYLDESTVIPIYSNLKEFQEKYGKLSK